MIQLIRQSSHNTHNERLRMVCVVDAMRRKLSVHWVYVISLLFMIRPGLLYSDTFVQFVIISYAKCQCASEYIASIHRTIEQNALVNSIWTRKKTSRIIPPGKHKIRVQRFWSRKIARLIRPKLSALLFIIKEFGQRNYAKQPSQRIANWMTLIEYAWDFSIYFVRGQTLCSNFHNHHSNFAQISANYQIRHILDLAPYRQIIRKQAIRTTTCSQSHFVVVVESWQ